MELLSGRPSTPNASSTVASWQRTLDRTSNESEYGYLPTLFDLIYISGLISESCTSRTPSIFLGAASVDSAKQIGSGASFGASLRAIPEGPKRILAQPFDLGGLSITTTSPALIRPKNVVFKVAKVAFDQRGYPRADHQTALQSILTEFHALLYPPLLEHPNVVNLLDIAWGTNPFNPAQRLPALVLEYADQGTLLDAINLGSLSSKEKRVLLNDVASGLQALHDAGLVHGDVKAENVLLFSDRERRIAKLGDFGFSVISEVESDTIWLGGTRPWQAPEVQSAVPLRQAKHTDTYSFGLLVWYLTLNGLDPFKRFLIPDRPAEEWDQELWEFKAQDGLRSASKTSSWFPLDFIQKLNENSDVAHPSVVGISRLMRGKSLEGMESLLGEACAMFVAQDDLLSVLDRVFEHSLVSDPEKRSLPIIIDILQPGTTVDTTSVATSQAAPNIVEKTTPTTDLTSETTFQGGIQAVLEDRGNPEAEKSYNTPHMPKAMALSWNQRGFKVSLFVQISKCSANM